MGLLLEPIMATIALSVVSNCSPTGGWPSRHERVLVLVHLLGGEQRVDLARNAIEVI
jgi:hypothetical protein